jgi:hypothetical protein
MPRPSVFSTCPLRLRRPPLAAPAASCRACPRRRVPCQPESCGSPSRSCARLPRDRLEERLDRRLAPRPRDLGARNATVFLNSEEMSTAVVTPWRSSIEARCPCNAAAGRALASASAALGEMHVAILEARHHDLAGTIDQRGAGRKRRRQRSDDVHDAAIPHHHVRDAERRLGRRDVDLGASKDQAAVVGDLRDCAATREEPGGKRQPTARASMPTIPSARIDHVPLAPQVSTGDDAGASSGAPA